MLISVIIPTYKPVDRYLDACLSSLSRQTINHSDFEIIIILNGCNEPYYEMVKKIVSRYDDSITVRIVQTDTPGQSNARNIGLEMIDSEYVCFLDYDDYVSDCYLERLYSCISPDCVVQSNVMAFDDESESQLPDYIGRYFEKYQPGTRLSKMKGVHFLSNVATKLIPRSIIANQKFLHIDVGEDALFITSITNGIKEIVLSQADAVYYRRVHNTSVLHAKRSMSVWFKNRLQLTGLYLKTYVKDILHYNLLIFLHRIAAVWKGFFKSFFF